MCISGCFVESNTHACQLTLQVPIFSIHQGHLDVESIPLIHLYDSLHPFENYSCFVIWDSFDCSKLIVPGYGYQHCYLIHIHDINAQHDMSISFQNICWDRCDWRINNRRIPSRCFTYKRSNVWSEYLFSRLNIPQCHWTIHQPVALESFNKGCSTGPSHCHLQLPCPQCM